MTKSTIAILSITFMFTHAVFAESPITNEWTCYDQKNANRASVPDETNPNNFEEWKIRAESISKPNYSLSDFEISGLKKVSIDVPSVGKQHYVLMAYRYTVSGVQNWGVFSCYKSN